MNSIQNLPNSAIAAMQRASSRPVIKGFGNRPMAALSPRPTAMPASSRELGETQKPRQRRIPRC